MSNTHQPSTTVRRLMGLIGKLNAAFKNGRPSEETLAVLKKEREDIIGDLRGRPYGDIRNRVSVFAVQEPDRVRLESIGILFGHRQRELVSQLREARKMLGLEAEPIGGDLGQHIRQLASRLVKEGLVNQVDEKEFGDLAGLASMLQEAEVHRFDLILNFAGIEMPVPSENTEKQLGDLRQQLEAAKAKVATAELFTEMQVARKEVEAIKDKIAALSNPPAEAAEVPEASLADLQQQLSAAKEARGLAESEADFNAAMAEIQRLEALVSAKSREDSKPAAKPKRETKIPPPPPVPTVESVTVQAAAEDVEFDLDTFRPPAPKPEEDRRQKALRRLEELAEKANGYKGTLLAAVTRLRAPEGESLPTIKVEELAQQWDEHIRKEQRH
ncbi:MAG TPA: hypothetical protein VG941_02725 [Candidatus Paceibacterota bacterium]|nr:hypothetical protein [Candidatus Paceibacterota bacterium]